jgi:glycosyltransferase involved in cell wall biosynthesis
VRGPGELIPVVGVLTTGFPRFDGDLAGNFVLFCCRALKARGLDVRVLAPHTAGTPSEELVEGIPLRRFRYLFPASLERVAYERGTPANLEWNWLAWLGLPFFALSFWLHACRLARRCDILHAHWIPSGLVALAASPLGRKPVVVSVWGSDLALARLPLGGRLTMALLRRAAAVIAISEAMRGELVALGLPDHKVRVIPTAVAALPRPKGARDEIRRELGLPADRPLVLYLGRLSTVKGPAHFVDAARLVLQERPDSGFVVVGDGHLRPELEDAVRAMGRADRFSFAGHVRHEEVGRWLSAADLFVLPSLSEGVPHALLEALAFGLPVVASAVGGVPEIVQDGVNGYLVPPGDSPAIARRILDLLGSPERRRAFGEAGRRLVEERQLTWDRFAAELADVYAGALESRPASHASAPQRPRPNADSSAATARSSQSKS